MADDIFEALCAIPQNSENNGWSALCGPGGLEGTFCANCLSDEWDVDEHRGDIVCYSCGAAFGGLLVNDAVVPYADDEGAAQSGFYQENVRSVAFDSVGVQSVARAENRKNLYKRKSYFRDRMSQWLQTHRPIPPEDLRTIKKFWREDLERRGLPARIPRKAEIRGRRERLPGYNEVKKEDIRRVLHAVDTVTEAERQEKLAMWPDDPLFKIYRENIGEKQKSYVTRYLEKWLTLRWLFTGQSSTADDCPEEIYEAIWFYLEQLSKAFPHCVQDGKRKNFPSVNEMMRNLLELLGAKELGADFPPLRTRRARNKSNFYWWSFCKYYRWPYLIKEANFLRRRNKIPLK